MLFRSLGSSDLVVVSLPRNPDELRSVHRLIQKARTMELKDIRPTGVPSEGCRGHACALVEPILAFRSEAKAVFQDPEFQKAEESVGLFLRFAIRVDCGHEHAVVADLVANGAVEVAAHPSSKAPLVAWAPHTIHGSFRHLYDFVSLLEKRWYSPAWREANLIETVTTLFFSEDRFGEPATPADHPKAWKLSKAVVDELQTIRKALLDFGGAFLGHAQSTELMAIFGSYESCFYRHEFVGSSRDLLPFFRQLAKMFSCTELWKRYLDTSVAEGEGRNRRQDRFHMQMQMLLSHLARAVRNRMEHRSFLVNPFLPTTLEHGACKLVSAYTVVFWLCSEMFRRENAKNRPDFCDTDYFAACLCAGSEGRVICQELFRGFRNFVENERGGRLLSEIAEQDWTARMLLLEISGKSLLRPELCLVHCMHEVAELSEWIRLRRCDRLRFLLNQWILKEFVQNARKLTLEAAKKSRATSGAQADEADKSDELLISWCVASYWKPELLKADFTTREEAEEAVAQVIEDLARRLPPVQLLMVVRAATIERRFPKDPDEVLPPSLKFGTASPVPGFTQQLSNERFIRAIDALTDLLPEIVGDIGMWSAFDHLMSIRPGASRDSKQRFEDVCRVYESLLMAVSESRGPERSRSRVEEVILHRWAIQAAAVLQGQPHVPRILERLDQLRAKCKDLTPRKDFEDMLNWSAGFNVQLTEPDGLVSALRKFPAYGGVAEILIFPELESFPAPVSNLIHAFTDAWISGGENEARVRLAFELWAKSVRLGFENLLEISS